jgi:hypothetical protein
MDAIAAVPGGGPLLLTAMSGARRERALARWRVLRPHLQDGIALTRAAGDCAIPLWTVPRGDRR